jgi:hypothetical protein
MKNKHQVHNLIILDESGSMSSCKKQVISGFNELIQSIKRIENQFPEQEHFFSLVSFNSLGNKVLHFCDKVSSINAINDSTYNPHEMTPLFDAMGFSINKLRQHLDGQEKCNVLVTVFTDGAENNSKEFTGKAIKKMVEDLKSQNWTFTYIGTDHDVEKMAENLNIQNTMRFTKSNEGINEMFEKESSARVKYSLAIREGVERKSKFYDEPELPKPKKTSLWAKLFPNSEL